MTAVEACRATIVYVPFLERVEEVVEAAVALVDVNGSVVPKFLPVERRVRGAGECGGQVEDGERHRGFVGVSLEGEGDVLMTVERLDFLDRCSDAMVIVAFGGSEVGYHFSWRYRKIVGFERG